MKKIILIATFLLSSALWATEVSPKRELLEDIKDQTKECVFQIIAKNTFLKNEVIVGYKSYCNTLLILSNKEAQIYVDNEWFTATISESEDSDGGDLNDLTVVNANGQVVIQKTNIASFNSVLAAMAGDTSFLRLYIK